MSITEALCVYYLCEKQAQKTTLIRAGNLAQCAVNLLLACLVASE